MNTQQLSAPFLVPAAFPAETRQGGAAVNLRRHGFCTDSGDQLFQCIHLFYKIFHSKRQLQDGPLFHPHSGTLKKFIYPKGCVKRRHMNPRHRDVVTIFVIQPQSHHCIMKHKHPLPLGMGQEEGHTILSCTPPSSRTRKEPLILAHNRPTRTVVSPLI